MTALREARYVYLHWTGGDYATAYDAYHFCVARDAGGRPVVRATRDVRENLRDVRVGGAYAAHTAGRNSHAIGVAVCGMAGAEPHDFGAFPLRDDQVALACVTVARLCVAYGIAIDAAHVRTHAEAALEDGYFGSGDGERWDIARLAPSSAPLRPADAAETGEALRARIAAASRSR